jgi:hypothetical protein
MDWSCYSECPQSNIGLSTVSSYGTEVLRGGMKMELGILTVVVLVLASQIPGDYHVVFFR